MSEQLRSSQAFYIKDKMQTTLTDDSNKPLAPCFLPIAHYPRI